MKAIVQHKYGSPDDLELKEIEKPEPKDREVLVRVHAAAVNPYDWHFTRGEPYFMRVTGVGLRGPKVVVRGADVAGTVEAVGTNVTRLQTGDEVYGQSDNAFGEYVCAPEKVLALKPADLTFEQAAAVPMAALTALQGLRDRGELQPGQNVLINGASGGVGTFAVQIARSIGAEVTGVCGTRNVELVRSLGADHVIDYTQEDFAQGGQRYDVVFDLVANRSLSDYRRALTPNGTLVLSGGGGSRWFGPMGLVLKALVVSPFVGQKLVVLMTKSKGEDLVALNDLIDSGKVTPVIDRTYGLSDVPEAIRYVEEGHARGKVVITVRGTDG